MNWLFVTQYTEQRKRFGMDDRCTRWCPFYCRQYRVHLSYKPNSDRTTAIPCDCILLDFFVGWWCLAKKVTILLEITNVPSLSIIWGSVIWILVIYREKWQELVYRGGERELVITNQIALLCGSVHVSSGLVNTHLLFLSGGGVGGSLLRLHITLCLCTEVYCQQRLK